jgi:WD40 repeat protein
VWEVTPPPVAEPTQIGTTFAVRTLAFSPDSRWLALGTCESLTVSGTTCAAGGVRLWDATAPQPADTSFFLSQKSQVSSLVFSPDGQTLAAAGADGITLWDMALRVSIGSLLLDRANALPPPLPFVGAEHTVTSLAFSPDGTRLAAGRAAGPILLWETRPASWQAAACAMANRNLTPAEWLQFLGQEPYRPLCPDLPPGTAPATPTPTP